MFIISSKMEYIIEYKKIVIKYGQGIHKENSE